MALIFAIQTKQKKIAMSNKIMYSIFIILFILMPFSILMALWHFLTDKISFPKFNNGGNWSETNLQESFS